MGTTIIRYSTLCMLAAAMLFAARARSATITWDGGGGDFSWQNATNWSADVLPGAGDDVVIQNAGVATITTRSNVTIRSLQCTNDFTLEAGTFRVTGGSSVMTGRFLAMGTPLLSASGAGTTLLVSGALDPGGANLEALNGATLSVPAFGNYVKSVLCARIIWKAIGPGSVLELSGLTNITAGSCSAVSFQALAGGRVRMPGLVTAGEGYMDFLADGTNSLVDLSFLEHSASKRETVQFEARNGGEVAMPRLMGGPYVIVVLKSGGILPVSQLTQLNGFIVSGMAVEFPALTNLGAGAIQVEGGALVTVPSLSLHDHGVSCATDNWRVTGIGSVLSFPILETIRGPDCGWINIQATAGGVMHLGRVSRVTEGTVYFLADGTNSLMDLGALEESTGSVRLVSFEARNHGTMEIPLLPGGGNVTVSLQSDGRLPVGQLRRLAGFAVNGLTLTFSALTNLAASLAAANVTVEGGGIVVAPALVEHRAGAGCHTDFWRVTGAGSRFDLPQLATVSGPSCSSLNLEATAGGTFNLAGLTNLVEGTLNLVADGAGSRIDLSALTESFATARPVTITARHNGTVLVPRLAGGPTVTVAIQSGGALDATQLTLLKGLTVSGTSLALPGIARLFSGDLLVDQGAVLSFPNLFSHEQASGCAFSRWSVSGAGSALDLSSLTNLAGGSCGWLIIEALAGGRIIASKLASVVEGRLDFLADGTNSVVDVAALVESSAALRPVSFEARNLGTIASPQLKGGPTVAVTLRSNGVMRLDRIERLAAVSAFNQTATFPALTRFDGGSVLATNGGVVSAPGLVTYQAGLTCVAKSWLARGAGSFIDFPGLTRLTGGSCVALDVQALGGGRILLGGVTNVSGGTAFVLSSGSGSVIDLHSVSSFVNTLPNSRLTATNGGSILLRDDGVVFSGWSVAVAVGTPGFAAATLGATNTVLHGVPWHSYWIERRAAAPPEDRWTFVRRVPLTNGFQTIDVLAAPNAEFRVREFIADPFALELARERDGVGVVLYGPVGRTFDLQAAAELDVPTPWALLETVVMTNTFRIFPREPLATPHRYFQVTGRD